MTYWQNEPGQTTPIHYYKQYGTTNEEEVNQNNHNTITIDSSNHYDECEHQNENSGLLTPGKQARDRLVQLLTPDYRVRSSKAEVRKFYVSQNEFINSLIELSNVDHHLDDDYEQPSTAAYLAIQISLATTFLLLAMKLFAAIYSGSVAVIASAFDSVLDLLSQGTLLCIHRFMIRYDPWKYPAGKSRFEPVSILVFSITMFIMAIALFLGSFQSLYTGLRSDHADLVLLRMDSITVSVLITVIVVQFFMWVYCKRVASMPIPGASAAAALADDHMNDVAITLLGGIPAILAGTNVSIWYLDSVGGILISLYIAARWLNLAITQIPFLVGASAPPSFLNQLTYLAATHDDRIQKIDTINAYHQGISYLVEVHIVLPGDMPLHIAHDIGETLETKIEKHPAVQTAFVHLDFETDHQPEHAARARAAGKTPVKRQHSDKLVNYPAPKLSQSYDLPSETLTFVRSLSQPNVSS